MRRSSETGGTQSEFLSHRQLVYRDFRKHKIACVSLLVLLCFYMVVAFCEFFAPYSPQRRFPDRQHVPPQLLRFTDDAGRFHLRPFVYGLEEVFDQESWRYRYEPDTDDRYPIRFFVRGDEYKLWGLFRSSVHLFGTAQGGAVFLFGTDSLNRDLFSRIVYGTRVSLTIGLVGVCISLFLGLILGGISGLYGGVADTVIQRVIEILLSIPAIPLWMALSAAFPADWSPTVVYFSLTVILSLVTWTTLARVARGKFISLRAEDYILAARVGGLSQMAVITRHMIPNFMSYILVHATLAVPTMILAETALSFLGIGLRPPVNSWGVLLQQAQSFQAVSIHPWLLIPGAFVVVAVLSFNFVGDGLRDAVDPHKK